MLNESLIKKLKEDGKFHVYIGGYCGDSYKEYTLNSFNECISAINYFLDEHIERTPSKIIIKNANANIECRLNENGEIISITEY